MEYNVHTNGRSNDGVLDIRPCPTCSTVDSFTSAQRVALVIY